MVEVKPQLGYWKIRGLAQPARYLLAYAGVEYENVMYELGDGPHYRKDSWLEAKQTLSLNFPNLPYMIDGKVRITESSAIYRYIVNKHCPDLAGKTIEDKAYVDMLSQIIS